MKYSLFLILAILHTSISQSNTTAKNSNISKIKWKSSKLQCKKFKCPPVEDLLCVRVREKKIGSKTKDFYIVMFNECELKYIECYQGYQATVVSMKNCGNHEKLNSQLGKVRSKRGLKKGKRAPVQVLYPFGLSQGEINNKAKDSAKFSESDVIVQSVSDNTDVIKSGIDKAAAQGDYDQETGESIPPEDRIRINDVRQQNNNKINDQNQDEPHVEELIVDDESEIDKNVDDNQTEVAKDEGDNKGAEKDIGEGSVTETGDNQTEQEKDAGGIQSVEDTDVTQTEASTAATQSEAEDKDGTQSEPGKDDKQSKVEKTKSDEQSEVEKDVNATRGEDTQTNEKKGEIKKQPDQIRMMGSLDYDLKPANDGVDFDEYEKDCPAFCPAREVMVCARCKDGIYRTFMSLCHLRMFNCAHKEERSQLVSRYPCILSAPYLAEAPSPKGRVAEPGDVDLVLHYIRCREKLERNRDDPECAYILKRKNLILKE